MSTPRPHPAFTLIELLAVMSIMTLMAGICGEWIPLFGPSLESVWAIG